MPRQSGALRSARQCICAAFPFPDRDWGRGRAHPPHPLLFDFTLRLAPLHARSPRTNLCRLQISHFSAPAVAGSVTEARVPVRLARPVAFAIARHRATVQPHHCAAHTHDTPPLLPCALAP